MLDAPIDDISTMPYQIFRIKSKYVSDFKQ